jgi:hypothetical protein
MNDLIPPDDKLDNPEREELAAKWHQLGKNCPSGNLCDTLPGENATYPLQGMQPGAGVALLERAAHAARELGPFSDKLDGFLGQVGLIAVKMMKHPLPDCSDDWAMLAAMVKR